MTLATPADTPARNPERTPVTTTDTRTADPDAKTAFADWLRATMTERGYPADTPRAGGITLLADRTGISQASITRALGGTTPDLNTLRALAPALRVSLTELLVRSGKATAAELADRPQTERGTSASAGVPDGWTAARAVILTAPGGDNPRRASAPADAVRFEDGWLQVLHHQATTAYPACRVVEVELAAPRT